MRIGLVVACGRGRFRGLDAYLDDHTPAGPLFLAAPAPDAWPTPLRSTRFSAWPDPAYQPVDGLTVSGTATLHSWGWHEGDDDVYIQPGLFYRVLDETNREHLVDNLVGHLLTVNVPLRERQMEHFRRADQDLADRVAKGLANSGFADRAATPVEAAQAGFSIR